MRDKEMLYDDISKNPLKFWRKYVMKCLCSYLHYYSVHLSYVFDYDYATSVL